MTVDTVAVHYNPQVWGATARQFNPDRWISPSNSPEGISRLVKPPKGAFLPFSEGARSCVGRKFAETEFRAIVTSIFETYSVELVPKTDVNTGVSETWEVTRRRALDAMNDGTTILTFSMKLLVPLRLLRRKT
jgi:cytochrome P450